MILSNGEAFNRIIKFINTLESGYTIEGNLKYNILVNKLGLSAKRTPDSLNYYSKGLPPSLLNDFEGFFYSPIPHAKGLQGWIGYMGDNIRNVVLVRIYKTQSKIKDSKGFRKGYWKIGGVYGSNTFPLMVESPISNIAPTYLVFNKRIGSYDLNWSHHWFDINSLFDASSSSFLNWSRYNNPLKDKV